jgi:hypothetical protein
MGPKSEICVQLIRGPEGTYLSARAPPVPKRARAPRRLGPAQASPALLSCRFWVAPEPGRDPHVGPGAHYPRGLGRRQRHASGGGGGIAAPPRAQNLCPRTLWFSRTAADWPVWLAARRR